MKANIIRILAVLVAIGLAFTTLWELTSVILLISLVEWLDRNKKPMVYSKILGKYI